MKAKGFSTLLLRLKSRGMRDARPAEASMYEPGLRFCRYAEVVLVADCTGLVAMGYGPGLAGVPVLPCIPCPVLIGNPAQLVELALQGQLNLTHCGKELFACSSMGCD